MIELSDAGGVAVVMPAQGKANAFRGEMRRAAVFTCGDRAVSPPRRPPYAGSMARTVRR